MRLAWGSPLSLVSLNMMSLYCLLMVGLASIPSIPSFKSAEASCPHGFLISQVADFVLTGDQKFAASSCGVSFSLKVAKLILSSFGGIIHDVIIAYYSVIILQVFSSLLFHTICVFLFSPVRKLWCSTTTCRISPGGKERQPTGGSGCIPGALWPCAVGWDKGGTSGSIQEPGASGLDDVW